jgi:hypothetical protein
MVHIRVYQEQATGHFEVRWVDDSDPNPDTDRGVKIFDFNLGDAIAFALGLRKGASARHQLSTLVVDVHAPDANREFRAGYLVGHGDLSLRDLNEGRRRIRTVDHQSRLERPMPFSFNLQ